MFCSQPLKTKAVQRSIHLWGGSNAARVLFLVLNIIVCLALLLGRVFPTNFFQKSQGLCRDLWKFETSSHQWTLVSSDGPSARAYHVAAWDPMKRALWIHGGKDGRPCRDLWRFDTETSRWSLIDQSGPSRRYDHVAAWDAGSMSFWVHGGYEGNMLDDLWRFTVSTTTRTTTMTMTAFSATVSTHEELSAFWVICLIFLVLILLAVLVMSYYALSHCKKSPRFVVAPFPPPAPPMALPSPPPAPPPLIAASEEYWTTPPNSQPIPLSPQCLSFYAQPTPMCSDYITTCNACNTWPWPISMCPEYSRPVNTQELPSPPDRPPPIPEPTAPPAPRLDLSIPDLHRIIFCFAMQMEGPPPIQRDISLFLYPDLSPLHQPLHARQPPPREWIFHLQKDMPQAQTLQAQEECPMKHQKQPKQPGPTLQSPVLETPVTRIPERSVSRPEPLVELARQLPPDRKCALAEDQFDFPLHRHITQMATATAAAELQIKQPEIVCTPMMQWSPPKQTICPESQKDSSPPGPLGIPIPISQKPQPPKPIQRAPGLRRPGKVRVRRALSDRSRLISTLGGPWWTTPEITPGPGAYDPEHPQIFGKIPGREPGRPQKAREFERRWNMQRVM